ncbi:MAG TPA: chromate transporter [Atribacterota bacterium]|nr:chromate transporter [Atribacterota bacterium]
MKNLIELIVSFMIIGIGAYGGGMATIPLIQQEIVNSRKWLSIKEMGEILAIAQMTPGPIAINSATFTGFKVSGITGSTLATIAVILPSLLILTFFTPFIMDRFENNHYFIRFSCGIQVGVTSLIIFAVYSYGCGVIKGWFDLAIALIAFFLLVLSEKKLHPILVIVTCGILGLIFY